MNPKFTAIRRRTFELVLLSAAIFGFSLMTPDARGQAVEGGKFGRALKVMEGAYAAVPYNQVYFCMPMTVECWAKIPPKPGADGILLSCGPRHSNEHWEIDVAASDGTAGVSFGGYAPRPIRSAAVLADGQWHFIAMTFDGKSVQLYVDGKQAVEKALTKNGPYPDVGPLTFGTIDGGQPLLGAMIDEMRISRVLRATNRVPDAPFTPDADTVGLWHFDEDAAAYDKTGFADSSSLHIPARLELITQDAQPVGGFDGTRGPHTRWTQMDVGSFFTSSLGIPRERGATTPKAISIRLGKDKKHAIAFDTDLLRVSYGWSGDFITIHDGREGLAQHPDIAGEVKFRTDAMPGWAKPSKHEKAERPAETVVGPVTSDGDFADPRPDKLGPLNADWAKYKGLYVHGDRVILSYTVGGAAVLEMPGVEEFGNQTAFTRTFFLAPSGTDTSLNVCDIAKASGRGSVGPRTWSMVASKPDMTTAAIVTAAAVVGGPDDKGDPRWLNGRVGHLGSGPGRLTFRVAAHEAPIRFKIAIWSGVEADEKAFNAFIEKGVAGVEDIEPLTHGGPARFPEPVVTKGVVGKPDPKSDGAYVVDTLTAPDDNPWKSFLRFSGVDFFKNGDAAICSISGDVWVVSGIDDKLENLRWRRYATGLFQPLGLKIVDDTVYVLGRDQITRLHDVNGDGEVDFYESFNNECKVTPENGHAYTTSLETDAEGNFYYAKCGDSSSHGGTVLRVDKYGNNLQVFATGVRNCNGLGGGPGGIITEADNEGEWVPASRIDIVKQGRFLGFTPMAHSDKPPTDPGKPIVWMPQDVDNSSGGQTWVRGDKWGLPDGEMLHTSYGAAALLHVMTEEVDGITQGAVYRYPFRFASGVMRARFRDNDGQLYLCGLRGWQTAGIKDGGFQRVRYTGRPIHQPAAVHIHANGILLSFTCALDKKTAADTGSFSVLQWNYKWAAAYGSRFWSVREPARQGFDELDVKSVTLLSDGKTVFLEIPGLRPAMTTKITISLDAVDGTAIQQDVHCTIHAMGKPFVVK